MRLAKMVYEAQRISLGSPSIMRLWTLLLFWNLLTVSSCPTNNNVFTSTGSSATLQYDVSSMLTTTTTYVLRNPGGYQLAAFVILSGQLFVDTADNITFTGYISTGDLSFRIDNIQTGDKGVYEVVKNTELDTPLLCNTVYITGSVSIPTLTSNKSPFVGESAILTCSSSSTTVPAGLPLIYTWQEDGATNPSDSRYTYSTSRDTLAISGVQKSDADKVFTCRAHEQGSHIISSSSSQFNIDVQYKPIITTSMSPLDVTECTNRLTLTCTVSSNPVSTITWYRGDQQLPSTGDNNVIVYSISDVDRTATGQYRCRANNGYGGDIQDTVNVTVKYRPDVSVKTTNATTRDSSVDIVCNPSGVPDQYTFSQWTHQWYINGSVINHPGLGNSSILTLTNLTYQYSGVYSCRVSNGVECSNNPNAGNGHDSLVVKAAPVINDPESGPYNKRIQVKSKINTSSIVNITFWSNAGNVDIRGYRIKDNRLLNSPEIEIVQTQTTVRLPVFSSYVSTTGTLASVSLMVRNKEEFGEYDIVLSNGIDGDRRLEIVILPQGQAVQEESRVEVGTVVGSVGAVLVCVAVMVVVYIVYRRYTCIRRPEERTASKDVPITERYNEGFNITANPDHVYNDIHQEESEDHSALRDGANIYEKPVAISSQEHVYSDIKHDAQTDKVYINMKLP